ncbi:HAD-IIB family hydrolase [Sagittula sp. SSi028]|uniref:HAD-IIB family hydrolase n=1 Tax=Sagittula sp. SSi028 TaxID=3400636 RepID=UPI003AF8D3C8
MRLIVFSDLDGTLLDHASYSWQAAEPALAQLAKREIPLVLATSKTAAEVERLHSALALGDTPAIVENGAGVYRPGQPLQAEGDMATIRAALARTPQDLRAHFLGFGDVDAEGVAAMTGLPLDSAAMAKQRMFSEPGQWSGTDAQRLAFVQNLAAQGVSARYGGRFLTLSLGRTKADAMREVCRELGGTVTIALGDAPNDTEMLQEADHGVIVRNDHGVGLPTLDGEATGRIRRTDAIGPAGWNEAILALLNELEQDESHG